MSEVTEIFIKISQTVLQSNLDSRLKDFFKRSLLQTEKKKKHCSNVS